MTKNKPLLKKTLKIFGISFIALLVLITLTFVFLLIVSPGSTSSFKNEDGEVIKDSIAKMEYANIGGIDQFILIRGKSKNNPVLLLLHGGPGISATPVFRKYNSELEDHFIVVYWDQRGSGKSFSETISEESMNISQFVEDTNELAMYLKEKFGKDRIFLLGHSWGSFLGMNTIFRYPNNYYAYIGTGQMSNQFESENLAYSFLLDGFMETEDDKSVSELTALGQLEEDISNQEMLDWIYKQRSYLGKIKSTENQLQGSRLIFEMISALVFNRELTLGEKSNFFDGQHFSQYHLLPSILDTNLFAAIKEVKVPIFFIQGKYDYQTSYILAREYFEALEAPRKEFFTFDNSAHNPIFEESEKFNDIIINRVRGLARE